MIIFEADQASGPTTMEIVFVEIRSEISAGTRGASLGPDAMYIAALNKGSDLFDRYDYIELPDHNEALGQPVKHEWAKRVESMMEVYHGILPVIRHNIQNKKVFPVVIAGAHGTAAATIKGLRTAHPDKRLGVIWIDAHGDLHSPYTTPSGNMHGMPLAIALREDNFACRRRDLPRETITAWEQIKRLGGEEAFVHAEDVVLVGVRDMEREEWELIREKEIKLIPVSSIRERGPYRVAEKILDYLGKCDYIFLSFDVDSMDSSFVSGTGTPSIGGLTPGEARDLILELLQDPRICCLEIAEVNPTLDLQGNRTAEITFDILEEAVKTLLSERTNQA